MKEETLTANKSSFHLLNIFILFFSFSLFFAGGSTTAHAESLGYADVVLDYFDSGAGGMPGPYGRDSNGDSPVPVSTDVVLGSAAIDVLSLPTGTYVTVGFTDETIIDGDGNDIFIREIGASGDRANVFVSSNNVDFEFLGIATDSGLTSFDLASIGFSDPVTAIRIVGLDNLGSSPGFDVAYIQVLPGSIGDPEEVLRTPVHSKFNTYLRQSNILELTSAGSEGFPVQVTIYNLLGEVMITQTINLDANSQRDIDVNALVVSSCSSNPSSCSEFVDLDGNGVVDTYGVVRLDFFEEEAGSDKQLLGRVTNYRLKADGLSYDFAFAKELRNASQGTSYSSANTFHPLGLGVVPNWTEIINLDTDNSKSFTYNLYTLEGTRVYTETFTLPPLGERDIQGGHEIVDEEGFPTAGAYLVEVVPADTSADYLMSVSRYSLNESDDTYNYALAVESRSASVDTLFVPITNQDRTTMDCAIPTNWLEVVNVSDAPVDITVVFRDRDGNTAGQATMPLQAKSQFHFYASGVLGTDTYGLAEITSDTVSSLIAQSLVYYQDCDRNQLQTAYVIPAKERNRETSATGTLNTFLTMESVFRTFNTTSTLKTATYDITSFRGASESGSLVLSSYEGEQTQISENLAFDFPEDTYGTIQLTTTTAGDMFALTLRIHRKTEAGRVRLDFIIPGLMR